MKHAEEMEMKPQKGGNQYFLQIFTFPKTNISSQSPWSCKCLLSKRVNIDTQSLQYTRNYCGCAWKNYFVVNIDTDKTKKHAQKGEMKVKKGMNLWFPLLRLWKLCFLGFFLTLSEILKMFVDQKKDYRHALFSV